MTDLSVWTDQETPKGRRRRRKKKSRKSLVAVLLALVVVLALVGGTAAVVLGVGSKVRDALSNSSPDYAGPGTGHVAIEVKQGQTVTDIARTLPERFAVGSTVVSSSN